MFASLRRTSFASPARQRRRIIVIVIVIVLIAFIVSELIVQVVDGEGHVAERSTGTWSAAVSPILVESSSLRANLQRVRQSGSSTNRIALDESLAALATGSRDAQSAYDELELPLPSGPASTLVAATLMLRVDASRSLEQALTLATSGRAAAAVNVVAAAGRQMLVADRDAAAVRSALPRSARQSIMGVLPWISTPGDWSKSGATAYVAVLAANPSLIARQRLKLLAVTVVPPPDAIKGLPSTATTSTTQSATTTTTSTLVNPTGTGVPSTATTSTTTSTTTTTTFPRPPATTQIPPASATSVLGPRSSIEVVAVVANDGNVAESGVVTATVAPRSAASPTTGTMRETVAFVALAPNASKYVELAPIALRSSTTAYRLTVVVEGPGGATDRAVISFSVAS